MTDSLSVTAGAVGIIVPALHGTRLLLEDLQQLKNTPKTAFPTLIPTESAHAHKVNTHL
jgi:hypothetical protein